MKTDAPRSRIRCSAGAAALVAALALPLQAQDAPQPARRTLRVGFVGVGGRGTGLLGNALAVVPDLVVPAVCDINPDAAKRAAGIITRHGLAEPTLYTDGEMDWKNMLKREKLDAVIIATPWHWHTPMAVEAMKQGIVPGVEVPCALSVEECWDLVNTSEQTGVGCMMLENWSFRSDNMALLNMVRQGLFGKIVHVHCAHSHDCIDHWFFDGRTGADRWPAQFLLKYNRDQYPTHSLGPVLSWCDINCGDRFTTLVSMATDCFGINDMFVRRFGAEHPGAKRTYAQGDIVTSMIRTAKGKTVIVNYDMQLPRPYDNRWLLQGTRGIYNEQRNAVYLADRSPAYHQWEPFPPYEAQYKHKLWEKGGAGGHGGVDGLMLRSFLEAVREKRPLPIDVYDSVTMSAIIGLSGQSIASGSQPVEFPDFTRGKWEAAKAKFALDQREFPAPSALTRTEDGMVAQTFALGLRPLAVELADVEVRITGEPKPYAGWAGIGNEPSHCLFAEEEWGIEIAVPKGAKGVVAVYAYAQDGLRRQSVTFEDRKPDELDDLTKGRWLEYPFTAGESADGVLRVRIRKLEGANCVLSRLKITIPDKGT